MNSLAKLAITFSFLSLSLHTYADDFHLSSSDFSETDALPVLYTCDGKSISPDLTWANAPKNTKAFAITLSDPDAGNAISYHWIIYNIPGNAKEIPESKPLPSGVVTAKNSWNKTSYFAPCPPKGTAHTYVFTIYALDGLLKVAQDADVNAVMSAIKSHTIQKDNLMTVYSRWPE